MRHTSRRDHERTQPKHKHTHTHEIIQELQQAAADRFLRGEATEIVPLPPGAAQPQPTAMALKMQPTGPQVLPPPPPPAARAPQGNTCPLQAGPRPVAHLARPVASPLRGACANRRVPTPPAVVPPPHLLAANADGAAADGGPDGNAAAPTPASPPRDSRRRRRRTRRRSRSRSRSSGRPRPPLTNPHQPATHHEYAQCVRTVRTHSACPWCGAQCVPWCVKGMSGGSLRGYTGVFLVARWHTRDYWGADRGPPQTLMSLTTMIDAR